jgi:hypothetical protein
MMALQRSSTHVNQALFKNCLPRIMDWEDHGKTVEGIESGARYSWP